MSESNGLPKGWTEATLGNLITLTQNGFGKRSQETGRPTVVLRLADITDGEISLVDPRRVNANPAEIQQYGLKTDDLLAIRVNGSPDIVGRVVRFKDADEPILFCDHFIHLRLSESGLARYLRHFADTRTMRRFVEENKVSSAGQNTVNQSTLMRLAVPIAPLPEQHRIVEKIEELFSDLDAGVASLQRAKANLKRYRASVLKSAVEGRLTEEWRKEHPQAEDGQILLDRILRERREKWEKDQLLKFKEKGKEPPKNWQSKYEEPSALDTSELPELPEGWAWATVDQVAPPTGGLTKNPNRGAFKRKLPYLRVANVYSNELRLVEMEEIGVEENELERLLLCKGDLLVVEGNGSKDQIGRVAIWDGSIEPCVHQNHIIKARPAHGMSLWMLYFLISPNGRTSIEKVASSTSGLYTLSISKVASLPIPLPPFTEQEQIVALVEERLSQIDSAQKTIDKELIRSKRLRQSILKRAFEGRLVPQDLKDEPASVLLERIKASREADQPKKKSKKVKAR